MHYVIYRKTGILHRDLSVNNVMFRRRSGRVLGVLNDWDLAAPEARSSPATSAHRTGTAAYMSLELLAHPEKTPFHEYRHDLESFGWILVWCAFVLCFNGAEVAWKDQYAEIKTWFETTDWLAIKRAKHLFATEYPEDHLTHVTAPMQPLVEDWIGPLLTSMGATFQDRNRVKVRVGPKTSPDPQLARFLSADTGYDLFMYAKFMGMLDPDDKDPAATVLKE